MNTKRGKRNSLRKIKKIKKNKSKYSKRIYRKKKYGGSSSKSYPEGDAEAEQIIMHAMKRDRAAREREALRGEEVTQTPAAAAVEHRLTPYTDTKRLILQDFLNIFGNTEINSMLVLIKDAIDQYNDNPTEATKSNLNEVYGRFYNYCAGGIFREILALKTKVTFGPGFIGLQPPIPG